MREQFPIQLFMEGSSGVTLELELARFARSHIQGLAQDAEEDVLVQAARKFIAEHHGSVLWVVDDVADADGIAKLLPAHQSTGQPSASSAAIHYAPARLESPPPPPSTH